MAFWICGRAASPCWRPRCRASPLISMSGTVAGVPLVRMTNVSLEPHDERGLSLEDMIASTDDGILVDMNKSLSIDDRRLSFRFGCEIGWEIKRGRLGRVLKNCTYSGV